MHPSQRDAPASPPSPVGYPSVWNPWQPSMVVDTQVMVAGFRDCSYDALNYLLQVEKLPLNDPIVLGLQQFLASKEEEFRKEQYSYVGGIETQGSCHGYESHGNQHTLQMAVSHDHGYSNTMGSSHLNTSLESLEGSDSEFDDDMDSTACDSEVEDILLGYHDDSDSNMSDIAENAEMLDTLAENNGEIGDLLSELFGLMDQEEMDSYLSKGFHQDTGIASSHNVLLQ